MVKRILLDMIKLRSIMTEDSTMAIPECYFHEPPILNGLKSIRELAVFRFTCRKCEDAPCISVCPAEALEKDEAGLIDRHTNLCISCKSCVTICPFGTMMTDFFTHHRNKDLFYDLNDAKEIELFIKACPPGVASITESNESPEENIYGLNDRVFIRDYLYTTEKP
jgi:Fe-S-cluster-containing hydrogenase component 2